MDTNHRENRGTSEFKTSFVERDGGVFFELEQPGGPGTVSLSSGPHKTLEDARAAGTKMVREILRSRIQAAGIARRGERPAFCDPYDQADATAYLEHPRPPARHWEAPRVESRPLADLVGPGDVCGHELERDPYENCAAILPLEGEELCCCGHTDGHHILGANTCTFEPCRCEEFTAAPAVEAVQ